MEISEENAQPDEVTVNVTNEPGSRVGLDIVAPATLVRHSLEQAFARLAPRIKVQGFRPGHAPRPLVERALGPGVLEEEALELALSESYRQALATTGVDPLDPPEVEVKSFDPAEGLTYRAVVSVRPAVQLPDYRSFRVERPRPEILEDEVDEAVEEARRRLAELVPVTDRAAQPGDQLTVDLAVLDGQAALIGESREDALIDFNEEGMIPGLAEGLRDLAIGDTRSIPVTASEQHPNQEIAGKQVTYRVTLKSLKGRVLPPIDDELARSGGFDDLPAMRAGLRERMEQVRRAEAEVRFENEVLKQLDEGAAAELPQVLVERQIDRYVREFQGELEEQGLKLDRYLQYVNTSYDQFRDERREVAARRARMELLLEEVCKREKLEVTDADVDRRFDQLEEADPRPATRELRRRDSARSYIRGQLVSQRAVERLLGIAAGEHKDDDGDATPQED